MIEIPKQCNSLIERVCKNEHLQNYAITDVKGSAKGDGYSSKLYRITVEGTRDGQKCKLNLILKVAPGGEEYRKNMKCEVLFERERYIYEEVLLEYEKLQQELKVPDEERFRNYCKFYGSTMKLNEEVIILDNMKENGYDNWNRKAAMPFETIRMVMKYFGKYHSLSFALREKKPETFKKLAADLPDILMNLFIVCNNTAMVTNGMKQASECLDPVKDAQALQRYRKLAEEGFDYVNRMHKEAEIDDRYSVICHGDPWCNNMMFKFTESGKAVDFCFLDWQLARFVSPVVDLSYFIMPNLRLAQGRVDELLRVYHESLSSFLVRMDCEPEKLFPFQTLQNHWKKFCTYGLAWSTIIGSVMTLDENEAPDFEEIAENNKEMSEAFIGANENKRDYDTIVKHAINYCVDNNYI